jgi:vacuolar-type H+-ATPase subunit H
MATKSLLRQIRDKESDLDQALEWAAQDSHRIVEDAQREAESIVRDAERDGSGAAEEYLRKEREKLDREIAALRERGREAQAVVLESAEARMPRAVEKIVKAVSLR